MAYALIDLDDLLKRTFKLEPLPATSTRLVAMLGGDPNLREVSDIISLDPALTLRVLRAANSAFSGSKQPVTTVQTALMRMGLGVVVSMAVGAGVRARADKPIPAFGLKAGEFWRHSVASALAIETAASLRVHAPPMAFTAALLHDMGKHVLGEFLNVETLNLLQRARAEGGRTALEAETEVLGVNHAELGGAIVQHWKLPEAIVNAIIHHHDSSGEPDTLKDTVYMANIIAHRIESEESIPESADDAIVRQRLGLHVIALEQWRDATKVRLDEIMSHY